jgi:uncharacterized protein YlzI (FlbEa/FlbD family)
VLDEPTDGVDPVGRRDIRNILTALRDQGRTIFLNSHLLSELEMVCDRVAILVQGKVFSQGTIDELTRESRRYETEVAPPPGLGENASPQEFLPAALATVARFDAPTLPSPTPAAPPRPNANGAPPIPTSALPVLRGVWPVIRRYYRTGTWRASCGRQQHA